MKKYFIDSNIFLRILTADDEKMLLECVKLIEIIKLGQIRVATSNFVAAEIVWTLGSTYKFDRAKITDAVKVIINMPNLKVDDRCNTVTALELYSSSSVKYIDALIASNPEIQSKKMAIISYDKDFDKLGVKRLEPKDLI